MMGILNFELKFGKKVKNMLSRIRIFFLFWLISFWLMADRVIFNIGRVADKGCVYTIKGQ